MEAKAENSHAGGGSNGSGTESSDEEDQDDSSSSKQEVEDVLTSFREKWQRELQISPKHQTLPVSAKNGNLLNEEEDKEKQAKKLFLKGIEMERHGKLYEAIQYYRRAVQLVPDIEFRIEDSSKSKPKDHLDNFEDNDLVEEPDDMLENSSTDDDEDVDLDGNLFYRIQRKVSKYQHLFLTSTEQKTMHLSALPPEIIFYILKWVVTCDLDLRSLEMCGRVCRGFYLCSRDSEIWRLACVRAWGVNCGSKPNPYLSWRDMFINRERLHFNGCYISKTTYIRHGENSFQDQFYRPWHLVAYYRYLRFFPEGLVLWMTTAEEPSQVVGHLKYRYAKSPSILRGHYRLKNNRVIIVIQRQELSKNVYRRNRRRDHMFETLEKTFHLEFQIQNHRKKKHVQLDWIGYSVITKNKNGTESTFSFDLINNKFPPLWFSRVKSYTAESTRPLT